jgi:hypothetical protein
VTSSRPADASFCTRSIYGRLSATGGVRDAQSGYESTAQEEVVMATKQQIVVEPRPDGRWARQKNGTSRAASLHERQDDAIAAARAQARREHAELVVKDREGRIRSRDSYGNDRTDRPG